VLLLQDFVAIAILLLLEGLAKGAMPWSEAIVFVIALPVIGAVAYLCQKYVLITLIQRFDTIKEYVFLLAVGWCIGLAQLANVLGLSYEIGAFIAGVALATSPISFYISENLKPLRDFFLIMFFFSLGASFELPVLPQVLAPALILAVVVLAIKPLVFKTLLLREGEREKISWQIGTRLGQMSEFALLIAVLAVDAEVIGSRASYLIQATTLFTFIVSSYVIMLRYPTPIAVSDRLRRD
jgi:Kef-type K+ transport system membrane component KefB